MKPLVVANWKMNPKSVRAAEALARRIAVGLAGVSGVEVAIASPFPYLALVGRVTRRRVVLAAQDAWAGTGGAYTGAVSPLMLRGLGVHYVILGHSERRRFFGEDDGLINRKVKAALAARLIPIIAIGEEHRESQAVTPPLLAQQLARALEGIPRRRLRAIVIAYEPVWAISTTPGARPDTPDNATRRAIYIRKLLVKLLGPSVADTIRVIYGGSATAKNASSFLSRDIRGMEGLLVGGASLKAEEFIKIVQSIRRKARGDKS